MGNRNTFLSKQREWTPLVEKLRLRIAELEKYIKGVEVNTSFMRAEKRVRTAIHRSVIKDIQKEIKLDQQVL